jgi:hypothetical protein
MAIGYKSKYAEPEPTPEVETVEKRFTMPAFTAVQIILTALVLWYMITARKNKGMVLGAFALTISLLHIYDHLFRVKRGPEHLFFLPKKENYGCQMCK